MGAGGEESGKVDEGLKWRESKRKAAKANKGEIRRKKNRESRKECLGRKGLLVLRWSARGWILVVMC